MSFYRKKPTRWTGETGRALRGDLLAQCVADYLMCPVAGNPYGVYLLDVDDVAKFVGVTTEDVRQALATLERLGFAAYDPASSYVWVKEMAAHQFDLPVPGRHYLAGATKRWYQRESRANPFLGSWYDRYAADFRINDEPDPVARREDVERAPLAAPRQLTLVPPTEGPMALFEDEDTDESIRMPVKMVGSKSTALVPKKPHPIRDTLAYFEAAFERRFGSKPDIAAGKDAALVDKLLKQHGEEKVRAVIDQLFVTRDKFVTDTGYTVGVLKACFNKLLIEATGGKTSATAKTSKTADAVRRFAAEGE